MNRTILLSHLKSKGLMDGYSGDTVWAVSEAIENLIELVDSVAQVGGAVRDQMRLEAEHTVCMLTSAVILADGEYEPGEGLFIRHLFDVNQNQESEQDLRWLIEQSERWKAASQEIPGFVRAAVLCDAKQESETARSMLREIQFIGNNVAISDSEFQTTERETVSRYVAFLEDFINS